MALGTPALATPAVGATGTVATTASFTPAANAILVAHTTSRGGSSVPPEITDSLSNVWTEIPTAPQDAGASCASVWYWMTGSSPSAMTVTATSTGATQTALQVLEITGADDDVSNFAFNISATGDPSLTMSAYTSGSLVLGFFSRNGGSGAVTPPSGFVELEDSEIASNLRIQSCYENPATSTNLVWASSGIDSIGYGLEIKEDAGGGTNVNTTGVSATGSVGTVEAQTDQNVSATGIGISSALGNVSVQTQTGGTDAIVNATGASASGTAGNASAQADHDVFLTGIGASSALGSVDVLSGQIVNIIGLSAASAIGSVEIVLSQNISLSGLAATGSPGTVLAATDQTFDVTGEEMSVSLGAVSFPATGVWAEGSILYSNWWDIAYGNNVFVMVSRSGVPSVGTSTNGLSWTEQTVPEANKFTGVAYGEPGGTPRFVAVSINGTNQAMYSNPDGTVWTAASIPAGLWNGITYGNGLYVAVGENGSIATSPDGISWISQTAADPNHDFETIVYGPDDGTFVATMGPGNAVETSLDAISWTTRSTAFAPNRVYSASAYGAGRFIIGANTGIVQYSDDGINWSLASGIPSSATVHGITYGFNGKFYLAATNVSGDEIFVSEDNGESWSEELNTTGDPAVAGMASGPTRIVTVYVNTSTQTATAYVFGAAEAASVNVTGVSATLALGNEAIATGPTITPTGFEVTASEGDVSVANGMTVSVTGVSAAGQTGTVDTALDYAVSVTGNQADTAVSSVTVGVAFNVSGVSATASLSDVALVTENILSVVGMEAATSLNDVELIHDAKISATGLAATAIQGDVAVVTAVTVLGFGASASLGGVSVVFDYVAGVDGNEMTATAGAVIVPFWEPVPELAGTYTPVDDSVGNMWTEQTPTSGNWTPVT